MVLLYYLPGVDYCLIVTVDLFLAIGLRKEGVHLDEWCKDLAPSTELRKWYGHRPDRFEEFARRYQHELDDPDRSATLSRLGGLARRQQVTLLTATKDVAISGALVLAKVLRHRQG